MSALVFPVPAYRGQKVVPFEDQPRSQSERNALALAAPPTKASGRLIGLLMQERQDRKGMSAASGIRRVPEPTDPHRDPSVHLLEAWAPVEDELRRAVGPETFAIWLADVHPHRRVNGEWVLACRPEARGWIRDRFGRLIASCAGRPVVFVNCENNQRRTP